MRPANISILHMATVFTQMHRNAIRTCLLTQQRKGDRIRLDLVAMIERMLTKACLTHRGTVVDVHAEKNLRCSSHVSWQSASFGDRVHPSFKFIALDRPYKRPSRRLGDSPHLKPALRPLRPPKPTASNQSK